MKMAVEMAAVSMEKPSGTSPSGGVPTETPVPASWLRDGGGSELFAYRGLFVSCFRTAMCFKLINEKKESSKVSSIVSGNKAGYVEKPLIKPLPPKEGNEEKKKKRTKKKKKKKGNKKKEVTTCPRVYEVTIGNRKYVAPNDYYDNESEYDDLPMPCTHVSDHDLEEHTIFDIGNLFGTDYESNDDSIIHVPSNDDIESSKLGDVVLEDPIFETSTFSENDDITYSGLDNRYRDGYDIWYEINGNTFYTFAQDKKSTNQNSGVRFDAEDGNGNKVTYYGYIEEIWELDYGPNFKVPLFRCKWFNLKDGVQVDPQYGMTTVDFKNLGGGIPSGIPTTARLGKASSSIDVRGRLPARGGRPASFELQRGRPSAVVARPDSPGRHGLPWPPPALPSSQPTRAHPPMFDYRDPDVSDDDDGDYDDYSGDYYRARHDTRPPRAHRPTRRRRRRSPQLHAPPPSPSPEAPRATAVAVARSSRQPVARSSRPGRRRRPPLHPLPAPATEVRTSLSLPPSPRLPSRRAPRREEPARARLPRRARCRPPLTHARGVFDEMPRCRAEGRRWPGHPAPSPTTSSSSRSPSRSRCRSRDAAKPQPGRRRNGRRAAGDAPRPGRRPGGVPRVERRSGMRCVVSGATTRKVALRQ
ncbi:hypothetical protein QYE76_051326 [Lolium multiflorum]|uniref:Transposon protein, putative, CACTA, En/Spm sub-class n=1 Tax=Lolium multiflorum TaxID=4521 RepID=A0AAD8ST50_LOLMU|nr:hypothetical protein QYE76_051326 [Lolium multiflorum]